MEETDHDRCCKLDDDAAAIGLTEMMYLKRQQHHQSQENDAAKSPSLGRQVLIPASSPICTKLDTAAHIKVYSYYEIDPAKLPSEAPHQLKSTRVVMVSEKCKNRVVVRYPSSNSLHAHLSKTEVKTKVPSLDEKYTMELEEAEDVLYRRVSPFEIGENKNLWSFWENPSNSNVKVGTKKGWCWSELKSGGMVKWGKRKKVQYLRNEQCLSSYDGDKGDNEYKEESVKFNDDDDDEDVKLDQSMEEIKKNRKRKRHVFTSCEKSKKKKKVAKNSSDRWSKERYKLAEVNMLKILKEKGAVFGKPILRPALRAEARKLIGDTGLLDHLLKHMAGKVAPGGQERFRRRHNADGAMEYWLESAELVNIRKEAGIQDPYWTPPPGWKPGDNPTQDPVCAMEFKQLKAAMAKMRRDMQDLLSKKQDQDDVAIVNTPSYCIASQNLELDSFLLPLKEMYTDLMNKKAKIEEQMMKISHSLCGMEQEMKKLKSSVEEPNKSESALSPLRLMGSTTSPSSGTEKETKEAEPKKKQIVTTSDEKQDDKARSTITTVPPATTKATPEDKAAKIERMKSGFRICRPQGTFLWPDMAMSPTAQAQAQAKVVVPLEDLFMVPTPPSVSSSTTSAPHLLSPSPKYGHPTPPVKPLPERRPVTVTLTTAVPKPSQALPPETITQCVKNSTNAVTITTSTKTSLINLNVVPNNQNDSGSFGSHSSLSNISTSQALTYQRRHHNETIAAAIRCLAPSIAKSEDGLRQSDEILMECELKRRGCSSSASSSSCLSMTVGTWLALATPNPPSDSNSRRG